MGSGLAGPAGIPSAPRGPQVLATSLLAALSPPSRGSAADNSYRLSNHRGSLTGHTSAISRRHCCPSNVGSSLMTNNPCQLPVPQRAALAAVPHYLVFNDDTVSPRRGANAAMDCQGPIRGKIETLLFSNSLKQHKPLVPIIIVCEPSIVPTPDPSV